ncbi:GMC oxidoreductase-domain-containing protein [Mycena albidolilacea]|uniref:GMC oxidoreductase-domain-containing protein n=1 Tax=Mycena albidolilacea TaxID=1033008 RepID=A0AAD7E802_9AGAR|nr:GMC oxidoreductase-domain-containing protein [Mycena albidolilacea]
MTKSSPSLPEPDVLIYWLPGWFSAFHHGFGDALAAAHNVIPGVALRGHASSRGVVQLTGSHPQDPLHIEKRHFEAPGGKEDIAALLEGFKVAQSHMGHPNISSQVEAQIFPTQALNTDEDIENHILETVFGASAAYPYVFLKINMAPTGCTASMGPDDGEFNPNAVLDGDFKIRGVKGLRVVDISSWAVVPGWFVATPTYMLSEKAADVIIAAAGAA